MAGQDTNGVFVFRLENDGVLFAETLDHVDSRRNGTVHLLLQQREVLRSDANFDLPAAGRQLQRLRQSDTVDPLLMAGSPPTIIRSPLKKFIGGEPMNPATNRVAVRS